MAENGPRAAARALVRDHANCDRQIESLEIGAGVGQNLSILARSGPVDAVEVNVIGCEAIRSHKLARDLYSERLPFNLNRAYDVIVALDVIEHVSDDCAILQWVSDHLRKGGIFVATVPAYQWLFSDHDRALHHFRRYTRRSFCERLPQSLKVVTAAYFNHLLFPLAVSARGAWSLKRMLRHELGNAGKQRSPKSGPLVYTLERILQVELSLIRRGYEPPWGLSVYCVARRAV